MGGDECVISFMKPSFHNVYQSITLYILKRYHGYLPTISQNWKKYIIFQVHKGSYRLNLFIWNSREGEIIVTKRQQESPGVRRWGWGLLQKGTRELEGDWKVLDHDTNVEFNYQNLSDYTLNKAPKIWEKKVQSTECGYKERGRMGAIKAIQQRAGDASDPRVSHERLSPRAEWLCGGLAQTPTKNLPLSILSFFGRYPLRSRK